MEDERKGTTQAQIENGTQPETAETAKGNPAEADTAKQEKPVQDAAPEKGEDATDEARRQGEEMGALRAENDGLRQKLLSAYVSGEARGLGVTDEAMPYILKLATLEKIDVNNAESAVRQVKAAVEKVLRDVPALAGKPATAAGTGSSVSILRNHGGDATRDQIRAGIRGQ